MWWKLLESFAGDSSKKVVGLFLPRRVSRIRNHRDDECMRGLVGRDLCNLGQPFMLRSTINSVSPVFPQTLPNLNPVHFLHSHELIFHQASVSSALPVEGYSNLKQRKMKALGKKESTQRYLLARLSMAKQFIDENLIQECSVAQLAREVKLSEFHFSRCFKEVFGMSPYQYYLTRKIHCSAEMLTRPGMDLTGVSLEMGFSELSTFSKRFKKVYGMAPLQYKKAVLFSEARQDKTHFD